MSWQRLDTGEEKWTCPDCGWWAEVRANDDGRGFVVAEALGGTGLQGMADRLAAAGGSLEIRSARGAGTTVVGRIPIGAMERVG